MKRILVGAAVVVLGWTASRLYIRRLEERADKNLILLADWSEVQSGAARLGIGDDQLLKLLSQAGAGGLLVSPKTVQDYLEDGFFFARRGEAEAVVLRLAERGVAGVAVEPERGGFRLVNPRGPWEALKDLEVGFDSLFIESSAALGFDLVLRVNHDPWLSKEAMFKDLSGLARGKEHFGFLLNTDETPGGKEAVPAWRSFLAGGGFSQLLFEFHPTKASVKLAGQYPAGTFRAHTIAPNELKDMTDRQQTSRWRRAVEERTCRFLLLHMSPNDTISDYLANVTAVRRNLTVHGWQMAWPLARRSWASPTRLSQLAASALALLAAIGAPILALRVGLRDHPWKSFTYITGLTLLGACLMAALADNPLTRLQIIPFTGIKVAFAGAWAGSFLLLYPWSEIVGQLRVPVRRGDILVGLAAAAVVGYLVVRMGNAGAGWKVGWEQGVRDRLEDLLIARPRFKEFAIGYPLLLLGLTLRAERGAKSSFWQDGRWLIGLGMIGPISMVNTFCHLHSPLYLAFWRSLNGIAAGALLGCALLAVRKWGIKRL